MYVAAQLPISLEDVRVVSIVYIPYKSEFFYFKYLQLNHNSHLQALNPSSHVWHDINIFVNKVWYNSL